MQPEIWYTSDRNARIERFVVKSHGLAARNVDVWVPPTLALGREVPVIYMHDGQNLFDPYFSYAGRTWEVIPALEHLIAEDVIAGAIVVGIWNSAARWREYAPQLPMDALHEHPEWASFIERAGGPPISDAYLAMLVETVKPLIEARYPVRHERASTLVIGSSMGGLISLYALERYPAIFGAAGCLSTHWPAGGDLLVDALGSALPPVGNHRLYFDFGTATLDAEYEPFQLRMDGWLARTGYRPEIDWLTRKFEGAEHNEAAWAARLTLPLRFLLQTS